MAKQKSSRVSRRKFLQMAAVAGAAGLSAACAPAQVAPTSAPVPANTADSSASSYVVAATAGTAETIRQAFETAFRQNGWTVVKTKQDLEDQEWGYTVTKAGRTAKVEVEAQEPDEGAGTAISVET